MRAHKPVEETYGERTKTKLTEKKPYVEDDDTFSPALKWERAAYGFKMDGRNMAEGVG